MSYHLPVIIYQLSDQLCNKKLKPCAKPKDFVFERQQVENQVDFFGFGSRGPLTLYQDKKKKPQL